MAKSACSASRGLQTLGLDIYQQGTILGDRGLLIDTERRRPSIMLSARGNDVATALPQHDILTVYGADWCPDCRSTKRYLDERAVAYRYVDLAREPEIARGLADAGYRAIPVVVTPHGCVLREPSQRELDAVLGRRAI